MNIQEDFKKYVSKQASSNTCSTNTELVKEAFMSAELNKDNFEEFIAVLKEHGVYFEMFKPQYEDFMFEMFNQKRLPHRCFQQMIEWITYKIEIMTFVSTKRMFKHVVEQSVVKFRDLVDVFSRAYEVQKLLYYGEKSINTLIKNSKLTKEDMQHLVNSLHFSSEIEEFIRKPIVLQYSLQLGVWNNDVLKKFRETFGIDDVQSLIERRYTDSEFLKTFNIKNEVAQNILTLSESLTGGSRR